MPRDAKKNQKIKTITTDVIVIGAGAAGCQAALSLTGRNVVIISPAPLGGESSSLWAQGGIAAAMDGADSPQLHSRDTLKAAAGTADSAIVRILTDTAPDIIKTLDLMGVQFDRQAGDKNAYQLGREACHSQRRILKAKAGDGFGRELMRVLIAAVKQQKRIKIAEPYTAEKLAKDATGRIAGVYVRHVQTGTLILYRAQAVILASGGLGGLYQLTTNPSSSVGRGVALAARAGARLSDLEFVQFHPTALDIGLDPAPLATEALRGEGARLINDRGHYFMKNYHPMAELAPRDIVSRAIAAEIEKGSRISLDCRDIDTTGFPALQENCRAAGLDPASDLLPVKPAAHYHMGGVATCVQGRTSLYGLWAAGEVAATGLHGANRLASNSLMEALVMGQRVAADILKTITTEERHDTPLCPPPSMRRLAPAQADACRGQIRQLMQDHVGVSREAKSLSFAITQLQDIKDRIHEDAVLADMALIGRLIATAALKRTESRGGHYRRDYPKAMAVWKKRSFMTCDTTDVQTHTADILLPKEMAR